VPFSLNPPVQASAFGHSTIVVELKVYLQNPLSRLSFVSPKQSASSIQFSQTVEFHSNEYEPADHIAHVTPVSISPGLQYLKFTKTSLRV
jgi:hypothetical protein